MTTIDQLNARGQGTLPGLIGIEFTGYERGRLTSRLRLRPELLAPKDTYMPRRSSPWQIRPAATALSLTSLREPITSPRSS